MSHARILSRLGIFGLMTAARALVAVSILLVGCGKGDPATPAAAPTVAGTSGVSPGGLAGATLTAGQGGGASSTGGSPGSTGGSPSAEGGSTAAAGGTGGNTAGGGNIVNGPPGPPITFTEFAIPTPSQPGWLAAGSDDHVWFTHQSTAPPAVTKVSKDGAQFDLFMVASTRIGPRGMVAGPDGKVWYAKQGGVANMTSNGVVVEYPAPNGGDSAGIALGPDGNLWFTQQLHDRISRVTPDGKFTDFALPNAASGPLAIAPGPDKNVWFTESAATGNRIGRITPSGAIVEFPIPTASAGPTGIVAGLDGNLWFTEQEGRKIGKITPDGQITEFGIPSGHRPFRIAQGPDGNLWFTAPGAANSLGRVTPLGQISEYVVPTAAADPYDIAVGPDQNLWFTELSANKLCRITNLAGGGTVMPSTGNGDGELGGDRQCTRDLDCPDSGKACGGDVCSSRTKLCALSVAGDPGSCSEDGDCWCTQRGATCTSGHCSFTTLAGAP